MEHIIRALAGKFAALLLLPLGIVAAEKGKAQFAFTGPEIFPIETGISQLKEADIDGDGLNDIVVVNNARSKITLLYNQTGKTNDPTVIKERQDRDTNELPPDSRFRIQTISSEKRISSLLLTDLNHDKKPDIAY
ncbi:MAG: FG-GAP repeat domain-containing protein [Verrucomicrobiota bacterium]